METVDEEITKGALAFVEKAHRDGALSADTVPGDRVRSHHHRAPATAWARRWVSERIFAFE